MLIGLAAVLKVFPLILFIPLVWHRQLRAASAVAATFLGANLAGLGLPGVSLPHSIEALSDATELWRELPSNGSRSLVLDLAGLTEFWLTATAVVLILAGSILLLRSARLSSDPFGWLALGLLAIPLSWVSYDLILIPAVVCVWAAQFRSAWLLNGLMAFLWMSPIVLPLLLGQSGHFFMLVRILIIIVAIRRGPGAFTGWYLTRPPAKEPDFAISLN